MSVDNMQRDSFYTPRRVQKCLFGTGGTSPVRLEDLNDESPKKCYIPVADNRFNQGTPKKSNMDTSMSKELSCTPKREFGKQLQNNITETPHKTKSSDTKLITPLTSENKIMLLPRVYRRKSLNILELMENFSPAKKHNAIKRCAMDELEHKTAKLLKIDENHSIPKARAALFQDKDYETKLKNITISTKNFYSNSNEKKDYKETIEPNIVVTGTKSYRKSFTGHMRHYKRQLRRHSLGAINCGVSHGIRKRKLKTIGKRANKMAIINSSMVNEQENFEVEEDSDTESNSGMIEETSSPEIDSNKRFFRTRKSLGASPAMVTISSNIKLKVTPNGKMVLKQTNRRGIRRAHKRQKLMDISFDVTDLAVDEPELEKTVEQTKIDNILKTLEDDWADDDYDTMDQLISDKFANVTPLKPVAIFNDVNMSPATELSNITSAMNITDISTPNTCNDVSVNDNNNSECNPEKKYYPLFSKGYSSNKIFDDVNNKSSRNGKGNVNWQLSTKLNGGDDQYLLDAGQKNFGATECTECGVIYQIGDPEDENAHLNYHNNRKVLRFAGWKTERVIMEDIFTSSRVILVEPGDPKQCWKKVAEVLEYVDRDLGLMETNLSDYEQKRIYLYIRKKAIIGVLVAEHIKEAHRMIPELLELDCCTAESSPAKCGINVVWTDLKHRKQGIATRLVDILRANFYYGYIMSLDDIAFSIPTPSGKIFAEKYTKTRNFKVYN